MVREPQTPLTRVLPTPQAAAISVIMPSVGGTLGAGVMACADTATNKAQPAIAINLIILLLPGPSDHPDLLSHQRLSGYRV